jgi:hypothetical protein
MQIADWLKPSLWDAPGGAIVWSMVGLSVLDSKFASAAEQSASGHANSAVVTAPVPFCVAEAETDVDPALRVKLRAEQSGYTRSDMFLKAGWATFNDAKFSDAAAAQACLGQPRAPAAS